VSQPLILRGERSGFVDAHRNGTRFIVHPDEVLTAFMELEVAIRVGGELP